MGIDAQLSKNASMSFRNIRTNLPLGLQARIRPARIWRSKYRSVQPRSLAAYCLVKMWELSHVETTWADCWIPEYSGNDLIIVTSWHPFTGCLGGIHC